MLFHLPPSSLWVLDKCTKYIDGVIYNIEMSLKEEDEEIRLASAAATAESVDSARSTDHHHDSKQSMSKQRKK